jgi:hypothetical protein
MLLLHFILFWLGTHCDQFFFYSPLPLEAPFFGEVINTPPDTHTIDFTVHFLERQLASYTTKHTFNKKWIR